MRLTHYLLVYALSTLLSGCSAIAIKDNHLDAGNAITMVLNDIRDSDKQLPNEMEIHVDDMQGEYIVSVLFKPVISYGGSLRYTVDKNKKMITLRLVEP